MQRLTLFLFSLTLFVGHSLQAKLLFDNEISVMMEIIEQNELGTICQLKTSELSPGNKYQVHILSVQEAMNHVVPKTHKTHIGKGGIFLSDIDNVPFRMQFNKDGPDVFVLSIADSYTDKTVFMDFMAPFAKIEKWKSNAESFSALIHPEKGSYLVRVHLLKKWAHIPYTIRVLEDKKVIEKADGNTNGETTLEITLPGLKMQKEKIYKIEVTMSGETKSHELFNTQIL